MRQEARFASRPLSVLALLGGLGAGLAAGVATRPAQASGEVACARPGVVPRLGLERHLRQLSLDLLGRPPTLEEYEAVRARGRVDAELVRGLMAREEFYGRMKTYHRALLYANVAASVYRANLTVSEASDGARPFELRALGSPRGGLSQGCDHFIHQPDCNSEPRQDPHLEPAKKTCFDGSGIPQPVSVDYDPNFFKCDALNAQNPAIRTCEDAVDGGALPAKLLYFCDHRRDSRGNLQPFLCVPDPRKSGTAGLVNEVVEESTGRVIAFTNPAPVGGALSRLDRCSLGLQKGSVNGMYNVGRGCVQREGWVWTKPPYWDVTGREKVAACAIDAQERTANPVTGASCDRGGESFVGDRSCGCGPRFRRCESSDVHTRRVQAINEEPLLIADSVLRRDESYFNILTTRRSFVNGVLSTMYELGQGVGTSALSSPVELDAIPKVDYGAMAEWREYLRGPQHAGVLTTAAFLLRYPTQRARVSHFYEAFLCKTFAPPAEATLPPAEDACNRENNLAKRCGCNYCHATIEPVGAHWGRYGERNAVYLDPLRYARFDPRCRDCALAGNASCDGQCGQYVMQAYDGDGAASLGLLKTYLYRGPEDERNIEGGPRMLVQRMMQSGLLESCAVRNVWKELLGREMSSEEDRIYMKELVAHFAANGFRLKALIEKLVTTDAYRRVD
jgi:hypothetical protein